MTEIVAAHLERVAREAEQVVERACKDICSRAGALTMWPPNFEEIMREHVAAALAACARESRKEAFEEAARVVDGLQTSAVRNRMARLIRERAVGEKAT